MAAAKSPRGKAERAPRAEALPDPHNSLFAFAFGQKEHAAGLLRALLPPALSRHLQWDSLTREPVSFVDARLRWLHSDLLFSVRSRDTGEEVLLYLLIEHQSTPHPLMAYRVLRYVTRVWEDYLRKHRGHHRLPLVVPAVVYHGAEPWKVARTVGELLDAPASLVETVARHVPQCGYLLLDRRHEGADRFVDEALTAFGRVALWAMETAGDDARVLEGLRRWGELLAEILAQPDGQAALAVLLRYILATHEHIDRNKLRRVVVESIDAQAGENVVTVYEQLIEEGRQKGLRQGRTEGIAKGRTEGIAKGRTEGIAKGRTEGIAKGRTEGIAKGRTEGRAELLLEQLAAKFGAVPAGVRDRIQQASADELASWGTRVLTAATLEDALASPRAPQRSRRAPRPRR